MPCPSGIYGLFRLDGETIDPVHAAALGLAVDGPPGPVCAMAVDSTRNDAVSRFEDAEGLTLLLGTIDDAHELADTLGLSHRTPPARLAHAALMRHGPDMAQFTVGEWSLLYWDKRASEVRLVSSAARRDRLLYAQSGRHVAIAPAIGPLSRLPWIGATLDPVGLLCATGRMTIRHSTDRTMLSGVRQVEPGGYVVLNMTGSKVQRAAVFGPVARWRGSFDDALLETEQLLRRIMRERLAAMAVPAIQLSGGLDSSALAWLAAEETAPGKTVAALTSVAAPGSPSPDESLFARSVAYSVAIPWHTLWPSDTCNAYRPSDEIFAAACAPPLTNRHDLAAAMQSAAEAIGATGLIDGLFGEMTLTGTSAPAHRWRRIRQMVSRYRTRQIAVPTGTAAADWFHVRIAPHRIAHLPDALLASVAAGSAQAARTDDDDSWGYHPGAFKAMYQYNEMHAGALRTELPYRDVRLLRLFASFPRRFMAHGGLDRSMARHLLAGKLPDGIRLRARGLPSSPDHFARLQRHATVARTRIAHFRRADVDEWIDLAWLDQALARMAQHGPVDTADANQVQLTAIAAEYLAWWRSRT